MIEAGDLAIKYNEVMERIANEINEENKDEGTFGVVYQPGLTGFKEGSAPFGQGYMSGLDWYVDLCTTQVWPVAGEYARLLLTYNFLS